MRGGRARGCLQGGFRTEVSGRGRVLFEGMRAARAAVRAMLCALLACMCLAGCGAGGNAAAEADYQIYYLSNDETEIIAVPYDMAERDPEALIAEMIAGLQTTPELLEYQTPIPGNVTLTNWTLSGGLLTLGFDAAYSELEKTREILTRAALVRTFTQIDGVDTVAFLVEGSPLTDAHGEVVGNMTADRFIYNAGREINTYEKVQLTLYFADSTGTKLVPVYRTVVYNSNILMERLVVEQLLAGPNPASGDLSIGPTVNPAAGITSISVRDGICYVSFDENFLTQTNPVTAEVSVYSLVNSLAELSEVSKVQISVQGDSSANYMDVMPLSVAYTRNLDIVETAE